VDIPSNLEAKDSAARGRSPSTPKRSRADLKEDLSLFDEISPIGSPKMADGEIRGTPKRRRSSSFMRSSMNDIFSTKRDGRDLDTGLSKSVDFSGMTCFQLESPKASKSTCARDFTPPRTRSQSRLLLKTPQAPRKPPRSIISSSLPNLDELPKPRRLFDQPDSSQSLSVGGAEKLIDYSAVMSIVGFISSFITRRNERKVLLSSLVQLISSVSINHRSPASALSVLRSLSRSIPEWVTVKKEGSNEFFVFSSQMKSYDVLSRLRDLKRERLLQLL